MKKIFREPLVHFLLIGVGLFFVFGFVNHPDKAGDSVQRIVITAGRIEQLTTAFEKTWQRPATDEELKGLIDEFVLEEVYYRQALAMGIDRDDTIIRRRLRQKMEFLTDDVASLVEPIDEELTTYLAEHKDTFRESPVYTFRQVYFNPEIHGDLQGYVEGTLAVLQSGQTDTGDSSLLPQSFDAASQQVVDAAFGSGFSQQLDKLSIGDWQGPIPSGLGSHLVLLETRTEGRLPELTEIRQVVEREWNNEKRIANHRRVNARLLAEYEIVIEWPQEKAVSGRSDKEE
jgi:hypothetical protein